MKIKLIALTALTGFILSASALAWNNPYGSNNSDNSYQSATGTNYQYDLSNPGDQVRYSVDVRAQMRDDISVSPSRDIDRGIGQYGGGIYND